MFWLHNKMWSTAKVENDLVQLPIYLTSRYNESSFAIWLKPTIEKMLRFFSRRKPKHRIDQTDYRSKDGESLSRKSHKYRPNKNVISCKIILLDGTDLTLDVPVSENPVSLCLLYEHQH